MKDVAIADKIRPVLLMPLLLGVLAAALSLLPDTNAKIVTIAVSLAIPFGWWAILRAERWLLLLLCSLIALPPLPIPMGDSGPHPALLCVALGVFVTAFRARRWTILDDSLTWTLLYYTGILIVSVGCTAVGSGVEIAAGSLARVALFAVTPFVFLHTINAPPLDGRNALRLLRILFRVSVAGALFACVDFYFQFPALAAFGAQFVWLDEGVFRRAQGLFYEASTLGNYCAFFLVMVLVALCRLPKSSLVPRWELAFGGAVFLFGLVLSYSRGSLVNIAVAAIVFALLNRRTIRKPALVAGLSVLVCLSIVYGALPSFTESYFSRLAGSLKFIWSTPDGVLSGRLNAWDFLVQFILREPWRLLTGVGYKTLPYSDVAGSSVIVDNTYLSLLVETGVGGLGTFLLLNYRLLQSTFRAAGSTSVATSFYGTWMFCFWIGELLQMLSGDIFTYWRVLPIYFWVFALAHRTDSARAQ